MERKGVEKVCVRQSGLAETFPVPSPDVYGPISPRPLGTYIAICSSSRADKHGKICTPPASPRLGFFWVSLL